MDGVHDLGGMEGLGRVERTPSEPVFAEDWERQAMRIMLAGQAAVRAPGGAFRHSIERMDPAHYLSSSYYEHWLTGLATLLVDGGIIEPAELDRRAGGRF